MKNIEKFIKIAQQLDSDEDSIRLIALQKCKNLLSQEGETWYTFLNKRYASTAQRSEKEDVSSYGFKKSDTWESAKRSAYERQTRSSSQTKGNSIYINTKQRIFERPYIVGNVRIIKESTYHGNKPKLTISIEENFQGNKYIYSDMTVFDKKSINFIKNHQEFDEFPMNIKITPSKNSTYSATIVILNC